MVFEHEVISNTRLNEKFISVRLKAKDPDFSFRTGQYAIFKVYQDALRSYSFASSPESLPFWEIFIDTTPAGLGTTYLSQLKKGDTVKTFPPVGHLTLDEKDNEYFLAGTGCGIAPYLSMIEDLVKNPDKKVFLLWGLREEGDVALTNLLNSYKEKNPNFNFEIILSQPDGEWKGGRGHLQDFISEKVERIKKDNSAVYLSGSKEFILQTRQLLDERQFPTDRVHSEACY